jgi:hypothetical protein
MLNLKNILATKAILLTLTMGQAAWAQNGPLDNGTELCGIPVCSVELTVAALAELNENQRYNYANNLVRTYVDSKDIATLENLYAVAKELRSISQNQGDADWVIREASTLANNAIFNLAKFSAIKAEKLADLFSLLDGQVKRYEIITYWQQQITSIENTETLNEIVSFADLAASISLAKGDEAWVPRAAASLASEITVKLTALDPAHEGTFDVKVTKSDDKSLDFDKMIILDSSSEDNLTVYFMNTRLKQVVYSYTHAVIVGSTIKGKLLSNGSLSSTFELTFDRKTGLVKGTIQTTRSTQIEFVGQQSFSTRSIFAGKAPVELTVNSVIGSFKGEILGIKGTLSVHTFMPNVYSASFVADNGLVVIDFMGKFFPKTGVLALTHKNKIKLVVSLRENDSEIAWRGVSFSTVNGQVVNAQFSAE